MPFEKKNLIYVFADQWRRDAIGHYNPAVKTPNIDRFMNEGFVFDRAYSSCPVCSPHRACLMSGKYPLSNGVFTNCKPGMGIGLSEQEVCLGDALKGAGYHTGYIGKWHLDQPDGTGGWDAYTPPGPRRHGFDFWYSYGTFDGHTTPHYWDSEGRRRDVNQWSPEHETDVALEFLKDTQKPFALVVSFNPPHSPYDLAPEKEFQRYQQVSLRGNVETKSVLRHHTGETAKEEEQYIGETTRGYYASVSSIDDQFGRLVEYLKQTGLYDDTVIVLSADHGDMMGSHGLMGKYVWFEEAVGIPLIFGGGGLPSGSTEELIGSPDHAPTVLGLLGVPVPEGMEGRDFSPLLRGEPFSGYQTVICAGFVNTTERMEEFRAHGWNPFAYGWRSVTGMRYKYAVHNGYRYGEEPQTFLYDLANDPLEMDPVRDSEQEAEMAGQLRLWLEKLQDPFVLPD